jgi:hypothetical protein
LTFLQVFLYELIQNPILRFVFLLCRSIDAPPFKFATNGF